MIRRKILFWIVWIPASVLVFLYYCIGWRSYAYYNSNMPAFKTGLVRQAVWEKMVIEKVARRNTLRQYDQRRKRYS